MRECLLTRFHEPPSLVKRAGASSYRPDTRQRGAGTPRASEHASATEPARPRAARACAHAQSRRQNRQTRGVRVWVHGPRTAAVARHPCIGRRIHADALPQVLRPGPRHLRADPQAVETTPPTFATESKYLRREADLPTFPPSVIWMTMFGKIPPDVPSVMVPFTVNVLGVLGVVGIRVSGNGSV
jgi:hypothetical protein